VLWGGGGDVKMHLRLLCLLSKAGIFRTFFFDK
jgi:hypothetical protein